VEAYIQGLYELTTDPGPASKALTTYSFRLAETRPSDLERAYKPQVDLVADLIRDAAESGRLHSSLGIDVAAHLLHHTVLSAVHARILGSAGGGDVSADDLWTFCSAAIGIRSKAPTPTTAG